MERIYRTSFTLTTADCDFTGCWKPSAIMEAMQQGAGTHGSGLGFGRDVLSPMDIVWVISRMEVVMDRYPSIGETVEMETFPTAPRRWFFPRYYTFRDAAGQVIGKASTLWALMDWETRKMAAPDAVKNMIPDNSDQTLPLGMPSPVPDVKGEPVTSVYIPLYSDLDVNGHVNNTRYMDMACNALGVDIMRDQQVSRFMITYGREILPEQTVATELRMDGSTFSFTGNVGDAHSFEIGGMLTEKQKPSVG